MQENESASIYCCDDDEGQEQLISFLEMAVWELLLVWSVCSPKEY